MAEKVIFEFRAENGEGGCGFEFKHGMDSFTVFGPSIWACCQATGGPGGVPAAVPKRSRSHMRETLDFFERVYDDLYGGEESGESRDPKPG